MASREIRGQKCIKDQAFLDVDHAAVDSKDRGVLTGERIGAEFDASARIYKQHVIYGTGRESKKSDEHTVGFIVARELRGGRRIPENEVPERENHKKGKAIVAKTKSGGSSGCRVSTKNIIEPRKRRRL